MNYVLARHAEMFLRRYRAVPYVEPLRMLPRRNGSRRGTIPFWTLIHALRASANTSMSVSLRGRERENVLLRIKLTPHRREESRDDFQTIPPDD